MAKPTNNDSEPNYPAAMQMFTLLRLLERRSTRAMTVNDLAAELAVHRRTVVRYVKVLAACIDNEDGRPILRRELRHGEAWAVLNEHERPLSKTIFQFAATYAASRHLAAQPVLSESVADVLEELRGGLRADQMDYAERIEKAFHYVAFGPKDYRCREDVLEAVVQSLVRRRPLEIRYRSRGAKRAERRRIEPWTLVMYRDGLYVWSRVLRAGDKSDMRLYAIDRIEDAVVDRGASFSVPATYDPEETFGENLGLWQTGEAAETVVLAFSPEVADLARERTWPGLRDWTEPEDGRPVLTLDVPVTPEVVSWVLNWGPGIEVLAPESLRAAVAGQLAAALARYT